MKKFGKSFGRIVDALDVFGLLLPFKTGHAKTDRWGTLKKKLSESCRPGRSIGTKNLSALIVQLMPLSSHKAPSPFPPLGDNAVTSHSKAQEKRRSWLGKLGRKLWKVSTSLRRPDRMCKLASSLSTHSERRATLNLSPDCLVAIKTGIGSGLLGILAVSPAVAG